MKVTQITDNMRRLMGPGDRKALGKDGMTIDELATVAQAKSEKELHQQIKDMLNRLGVRFYGYSRMDKATGCTVGWPDFVIPLPGGKVLFWEVKNGHKVPRPEQVECLKFLNEMGQRWALIQSYRQAHECICRHLTVNDRPVDNY